MNDSAVETALIAAAKALTTIPVYEGNVPASIGTSMWARITYAPGEVEAVGIGLDARERIYGVVMMDIFGPKGESRTATVSEATKIMQGLKRGDSVALSGGTLTIVRAYREVAIEEDNWYHIPVRIEFRAELER